MKYCLILLIGVFGTVFFFGQIYAQNAYDSACYFPQMGNPAELDTIYGAKAYQHLGQNLQTFPPRKGEKYDMLAMDGLPGNVPFLSETRTGPGFDIHHLGIIKKFGYEYLPGYVRGHFRSQKYTDLLYDGSAYPNDASNPKIYWADENGDFDSTRYTVVPSYIRSGGGRAEYMLPVYHAYLTSDSVEDIVFCLDKNGIPKDTLFLAIVKGGHKLYDNRDSTFPGDKGRDSIFPDEKILWGIPDGNAGAVRVDSSCRNFVQGNFRGIGRTDLVAASSSGDYFYYKNDSPFSLQKLWNALRHDTLLTVREWSHYNEFYKSAPGGGPIRAFPKHASDHSDDLMITAPLDSRVDTADANGICFFRGGVDFGTTRLSLNNPDYFLHSPAHYSGDFFENTWPYGLSNIGDLTGTGNNVLFTSGGAGLGYSFVALYVLGKALDDKIDVFFPLHYGGGSVDTVWTSDKGFPSFIMSSPAYMLPEDQSNGEFEKGRVQILNGKEKIPVRINPQFANVHLKKDSVLGIYPNPVLKSFHLTAFFDSSQPVKIIIRDILGRVIYSDNRLASGGAETFHFDIPEVAAGTYFLEVTGNNVRFIEKISVLQ